MFDRVAQRYGCRPSEILAGFSPVQAAYFDLLCAGVGAKQDAQDRVAQQHDYEQMLSRARRGW